MTGMLAVPFRSQICRLASLGVRKSKMTTVKTVRVLSLKKKLTQFDVLF